MIQYELPHESQGYYPVCTAIAATRALEWQFEHKYGVRKEFNLKQVYIEAGGSVSGGSSTDAILKVMKERGVIEAKHSVFEPYKIPEVNWIDSWRGEAERNKGKQRWYLTDYHTVASRVTTDEHREKVLKALEEHGVLLITVDAYGDWYKGGLPDPDRKRKRLHSIAMTGYDGKEWIGSNSWRELSENGSVVKLHQDYPFMFVQAMHGIEPQIKSICI